MATQDMTKPSVVQAKEAASAAIKDTRNDVGVIGRSDVASSEVADIARAADVALQVEALSGATSINNDNGCFFCFVNPIGAIIASSHRQNANKALKEGKIDEAKAELDKARAVSLISFLIGLVVWGIAILIIWNQLM